MASSEGRTDISWFCMGIPVINSSLLCAYMPSEREQAATIWTRNKAYLELSDCQAEVESPFRPCVRRHNKDVDCTTRSHPGYSVSTETGRSNLHWLRRPHGSVRVRALLVLSNTNEFYALSKQTTPALMSEIDVYCLEGRLSVE